MRQWRRAALGLAAGAMLLGCTACGSSQTAYDRDHTVGSGSSQLKIAYSAVANGDSAPWAGVLWDALETACDAEGWTLDALSAGGVPADQTKQIDQLLEGDPDYFIIFAGDVSLADQWVKKVHDAGVPVIMASIDATGDMVSQVSAFVGPDQEALAAQLAADLIGAQGADAGLNVVTISGFQCQQDYILRQQGFEKTLTYFSNYSLLATEYAGASRSQAESIMDQYFTTYGDSIDVVMCYDDEFAMGALSSIESHGKSGQIQVYSITGSEEAIQAVADGAIVEVAVNSAAQIAQGCVEVISGLEQGVIPNHYTYTDRTYITADNAKDYSGQGEY
jgi:ABC-type sugar transport system substrate-binding protein